MKFVDDTKIPDHPYPELRPALSIFVDEIAAELKEKLVGIYLVGSLAAGGFDLDSDVDFLAVTNTELTGADMTPIQNIQQEIHDIGCYPAEHLEGSYASIGELNDWSTVGQKKFYYFDNGSTTFEQSTHDNQWHVRWILRERGITLIGPKPETFLRAIPGDKLRSEMETAMLQNIELFTSELDRPLGFCNSRFGQSFFVLTYCRMLHTLNTGTVQSKRAGVTWAKQFVDPKWVPIIEQAWKERDGVRFGVKIGQRAESTVLYETLDFMRYAVTYTNTGGGK